MARMGKMMKKRMLAAILVFAAIAMMLSAVEVSAKALPKDPGRIVFQGRIKKVSHKGLLRMQKLNRSPNASDYQMYKNKPFYVIKLDRPKSMRLSHVDGMLRHQVKLIDITNIPGIGKYVNKRCTFSIKASDTWWPSDSSLPLGEPRTWDIHIYDKKTRSWAELKYVYSE